MRTFKYSRTRFHRNGKRFITHTTRFYPNNRNYRIKTSYLSALLTDKFKLYKHKFKKARYIPGFYSSVEYVSPIIDIRGFKRR